MRLENFAVAFETHVLARPLPGAPRQVMLPDVDEPIERDIEHLGEAEGQSFMIEYVDSGGRQSSRRISVYGLAMGSAGIPLLTARCHERKATRQFRVDRIRCCIDYSGEIHDDVATFLFDNFGMSLSLASRKADAVAEARWRDILNLIRDDAVVLAAMSQSDGTVHSTEVDVATRHLASAVERTDIFLTPAEIDLISAHFQRLRPSGRSIGASLDNIAGLGARHVTRLLRAALAVLDADGKRHSAEVELLNRLCVELTGVTII
ncbi:WYL domain-containing protein [Mesorhizobium sp. B2-1-3A]|uniref:tellurite resistance TerB family protein n=1 Tax=Mesorhizobium sp. B2-1-3A TaxID=2589971 RepID=UPI0015E3C2F5|nr:WYL domain-containing protein [Mesorhizobium sp. B2-1-3A]